MYMSPESMQFGNFTPASDVYAFGIVAWEIFSEEDAFSGKSPFEVIDYVVNHQKTLTLDNLHTIDPTIRDLITTCLSFDPQDRPCADALCKTLSNAVRKAS